MNFCHRCLSKGVERAAVQEVCLDFGTDFEWEHWCADCVEEEVELVKSRYADGTWSAEDAEAWARVFLFGPPPAEVEG